MTKQFLPIIAVSFSAFAEAAAEEKTNHFGVSGYAESVSVIERKEYFDSRITSSFEACWLPCQSFSVAAEIGLEMCSQPALSIDQLYVSFSQSEKLNLRLGYLMLPMGSMSYDGDPIGYLSTNCDVAETCIIPSTWNEIGVELSGNVHGFSWQTMLVGGASLDGFSADSWASAVELSSFTSIGFKSPAFLASLGYDYEECLSLRLSGYYAYDLSKNSSDNIRNVTDSRVSFAVFSSEAVCKSTLFRGRINSSFGKLKKGFMINDDLSISSIAEKAFSIGAEIGMNALYFVENKMFSLFPFARFETYALQQTDNKAFFDNQVKQFTLGIDWFIRKDLVFKVDYSRQISGNQLNDCFGFSLAYSSAFMW